MNYRHAQFALIALFITLCGMLVPGGRAQAISVQYFQFYPDTVSQGQGANLRAHCQGQDGIMIYDYPVYGGYPYGNIYAGGREDVTLYQAPSATKQYWMVCQDNTWSGYDRAYYGPISLTVRPPEHTTLSSFRASPTSVVSGNASTLSWGGVKGTKFSSCKLSGGQFGDSAWFSTFPGSVSTGALADTTTYKFVCYDNDGATTAQLSATVSVTDLCSNIPGNQGSAPANGIANTNGTCSCNADYTLQGATCVAVADACSNIGGVQASAPANAVANSNGTCSCNAGYNLQGATCVAVPVCTGVHQVGTPPNCSCDTGYQMQGGSCVQIMCPGAHEANWPTCACTTGYIRDTGTNMCIRQAQLNITVNGQATARVRKGNPVTVAWSSSGVIVESCRVTINTGETVGSQDSGSISRQIGAQTTFKLSCTNDAGTVVSKEANVTLIPDVIEQ